MTQSLFFYSEIPLDNSSPTAELGSFEEDVELSTEQLLERAGVEYAFDHMSNVCLDESIPTRRLYVYDQNQQLVTKGEVSIELEVSCEAKED